MFKKKFLTKVDLAVVLGVRASPTRRSLMVEQACVYSERWTCGKAMKNEKTTTGQGKICGGNGNSKISPAYSWNIPQAPVYEENPSICDIFVLWGTWGMFQGSVGFFWKTQNLIRWINRPREFGKLIFFMTPPVILCLDHHSRTIVSGE